MLEVFEPVALNYFTFFRSILSTLSASRNPILTHLSLSEFLDSLLCVLIAPCSSLSPKSNPKAVHSLLCSIASFSNFLNCSPPRESASVYAAYLRSHFSVFQPKALPEAAFLSFAEPRAPRSLTRSFALLSHLLNFLRLPLTFPPPLPLAQTKLPILC